MRLNLLKQSDYSRRIIKIKSPNNEAYEKQCKGLYPDIQQKQKQGSSMDGLLFRARIRRSLMLAKNN